MIKWAISVGTYNLFVLKVLREENASNYTEYHCRQRYGYPRDNRVIISLHNEKGIQTETNRVKLGHGHAWT